MLPAHRPVAQISRVFLVFICVAAFALMVHSSLQEPAIVDEDAHIPAGYGYVRHLDFRLNPEHPPGVKALAALPLLALELDFPTANDAWTKDVNGQWTMGTAFLYQSGNNADVIVQVSRLMPMLLTILLVILIYFWSREFLGNAWALLPAFLFAFSPTVLAHGHYVTTDIGAAFGVLLGNYFFLRCLREPSPKSMLFAGLALGVAELMKFSAVLLFPYFALLAVIHFFVFTLGKEAGAKYLWKAALGKLGQLAAVVLIAFTLVIYPVYGLFTVNYPQTKQVADSQEILKALIAPDPGTAGNCGLICHVAKADIWMAEHTATRPLAEYFLGVLMVFHRSTNGNTAYFLGEVSANGSHAYFPAIYLLKESLPTLVILLGGLLSALWVTGRAVAQKRVWVSSTAYLREHFVEFALAVFVIGYWAYSIRSTLNIGVRHLMPVLPIMYMLAAIAWRRWVTLPQFSFQGSALEVAWRAAKAITSSWLKFSILCALLLWVLLETLTTAPHFLSYFNEVGSGTWNGYRYATDSNYDWGQDLRRLKRFIEAHPEIDKIGVDYFGTPGAPAYYLGDRKVDWWSARGNPADQGIRWLAVSIYTLQNAVQPAAPDFPRGATDNYGWLTALRPPGPGLGHVPEPDYRVGTTIFVYRL